jgi:hypothetical protein
VLGSLALLRRDKLHRQHRSLQAQGGLLAGFHYVWSRPDLKVVLFMLFLLGTFGLNFPIFISTMAVSVFHAGAHQYGLLTSAMAIGSVTGHYLRPGPGSLVLVGLWARLPCLASAAAARP